MTTTKERGRLCRKRYLEKLRAQGIELTPVQHRLYFSSNKNLVALLYARELDQQPYAWWQGAPDMPYDVVICLCETNKNDLLDFVFPPHFIAKVWKGLTRTTRGSTPQRQWHIKQNGSNYDLRSSGSADRINEFLSNLNHSEDDSLTR